MAKLLSDSSAEDFRRMQQAFKNPGTKAPGASYRPSVEWIMMELVTDQGDDLWTAKAVAYDTTANDWTDITDGRETSEDVPLLVQGGGSAGDVVRAFPSRDTDGDPLWIAVRGGGGLNFITSDNTGLSFNDGAIFDRPQGTGTALASTNEYYIATPWNTRVVAPDNFFGYCTKVGEDFYYQITKFYVRCDVNYSGTVNEGVDQFTCFLSRSASSTNLGAQTGVSTPFPTGCEAFLDGFDNVNATTNSKNYFNGKVFPATYDSGSNKIYLEHPQF